ncbi:kazrin-like isoform X3 [Pollicipes pollicipes]|uniref:kazrin-like isoform X3 n=1 Tax=Pollicipes pollicipes TaxID=41117 RepID=UPI0018851599|nr:kazrin-like isoform X3 [Pollicipes pollicipes]
METSAGLRADASASCVTAGSDAALCLRVGGCAAVPDGPGGDAGHVDPSGSSRAALCDGVESLATLADGRSQAKLSAADNGGSHAKLSGADGRTEACARVGSGADVPLCAGSSAVASTSAVSSADALTASAGAGADASTSNAGGGADASPSNAGGGADASISSAGDGADASTSNAGGGADASTRAGSSADVSTSAGGGAAPSNLARSCTGPSGAAVPAASGGASSPARARSRARYQGRAGGGAAYPGRTAVPLVAPPPVGGGVFSRAFARHNKDLAHVLQSLEQLHTQLSEVDVDYDDVESLSEGHKTALYASVVLVKQMLNETQTKFHSMMEDNQILGSRIDSNLQVAQSQVTDLRSELADTHRMIDQLAAAAGSGDRPRPAAAAPPEKTKVNGVTAPAADAPAAEPLLSSEPVPPATEDATDLPSDEEHTYYDRNALLAMDQSRLVEACLSLQSSHQALRQRGRGLRSQVAGLSGAGDALEAQTSQLRVKLKASEAEVALTKEALAALKADRKRLKAEKFDLLNQMKQLYQTLEDKERELRDFIRNYEQRIKENDESLRTLAAERDETEREKWNILKHARDETERSVGLSAELSNKDGQLKHITEELTGLRKQLSQLGYYSDQEAASRPSRAAAPPPAAAPALAPAPPSLSPGALGTPNGRGSSADSGVRVSSDRDSVAAGTSGNLSDSTTSGEAGAPAHNPDGVPTDYDSISIVSSVTACSPYYYYAPADGQRGSPTMSPLTLSHTVDVASISKSAEQLDSLDQLDRKLRPKGAKQGTWGSISRVFSRQKQRKQLHMGAHTNDETWSPHSSLCSSPLTDESYAEKLRLLEEAQQLPMERWKASMVLAWLQVTLGMPQYGPACAENVRSGKVMLELTDVDLERGLGILQPMHKKKLRLAIEELRQPHLCKYPYISQLNHGWVAAEWLPDVGLAQYSDIFSAHLMDGRMLAHLTKKDMEKYLNVTRKFHQVSMLHGIQLLRLLQFDRQIICERRQRSELNGDDVLVWTNARFVHWARSIDLAEYADNLKDSGVHGALVTLELSFTADTMATALGVPQSKSMIRRHLAAELDKLVRPARVLLDEEARYARWEQERRRADRPAAATLGRPFSRSYASGLQRSSDKDKRGSSLRGSLSRAFGLKTRQELQQREPVYETPRASAARAAPPPPPPLERPQSVVTTSSESRVERQHRRIKSISDMETITVTPV